MAKDTKKKHRVLKAVGAATAIGLPIGYYVAGNNLFNKLCKVNPDYADKDIIETLPDDKTKEAYANELTNLVNWFKKSHVEKANVSSFDGLTLDAIKVKNHDTNKYLIMLHAYNSDRYALLKQAKEFDEIGYNLLMVDQRAWGNSEGKYTTLGFKESLDVLSWINYLCEDDENIEIGLYGVGMGASVVLKTLSYALKDNVKFAIADSAYTSLKDIIEYHLKTNLLTPTIALNFKRILGFDFNEMNAIEALSNNEIPLLLLCARNDEVTPSFMTERLFEVNKGKVDMHLFEETGHNYSCFDEDYFKVILNFIEEL